MSTIMLLVSGRWMVGTMLVAGLLLAAGAVRADAGEAGRTFYVDYADGSDDNDGLSAEAAVRHAPGDARAEGAAAAIELEPGDRVIFKGGVAYRGALTIGRGGSAAGGRVVYDGNVAGEFGEGRAVLDGSDVLTDWRRAESAAEVGGHEHWERIWIARAPAGAAALTANLHQGATMLTLAQHPTPSEPLAIDRHAEYLRVGPEDATETSLRDERLAELGGEALVGASVFVWRSRNDVDTRRIEAYDGQTHTITFEALGAPPYDNQDTRYAIANAATAAVLDGPGQYAVLEHEADEDGRVPVYFWPLDDADPNDVEVTISLRGVALQLGPQTGHLTIEGFRIQRYRQAIDKVHWNVEEHTSDITIRNNEITGIRSPGYANAVYLYRVDDLVIEDNYLHDNPKMRGLGLHTGERPIFRNNRLIRMGRTPIIMYFANDGKIQGNYIAHNRGTHSNGLSVYLHCENILVEGNYVYDSNVPFTCNDTTGLTVRNNVFDGSGSQPISFWQGVSGEVRVENNTLVGGGRDSGLYIGGTGDRDGSSFEGMHITFVNNIMDGPIMNIMNGRLWTRDVERRHNIYLNVPEGFEPGEGEMVVDDPAKLFVDFEGADYRLREGSPAIDAGASVDVAEDIEGAPRPQGDGFDVGAYEWGE
ncbi:MAG: right-handed parallel beta-helix repeat-containing protein [Phycisphaeraceae bacterium]